MPVIEKIFEIAGSLGLFLFGMKIMGDGLQNAAGSRIQKLLNYMTANRFTAFATGVLFTAIIQSSSATTVFVVSFVNAGLLNLTQAIGVILGANIGTTATAWLVSFFGFKFNIADLAIPAIAIGLPFMFSKGGRKKPISDIFIGFGLLFLGLMFLKNSVPNVKNHPEILQGIATLSQFGFASTLLFVLAGAALTIIVQSSSAAMAITLTMANAGWIEFPMALALVLGENIGTTITAQLAAIGQSHNSRRAAMAHTLFNVIGVLWMLILLPIFTQLIDALMPGSVSDPQSLPLHLSLFHTIFNLINAALFIGFIPSYARLIERLLPTKDEENSHVYHLSYLSASLQDTPELNYITVMKEIERMAQKVMDMYHKFSACLQGGQNSVTPAIADDMYNAESYVDQMQEEISRYIARCMQDRPSEGSTRNLGSLIKTIDDMETISDSSARLIAILMRAHEKRIDFPKINLDSMLPFIKEVGDGLAFVVSHAGHRMDESAYQETVAIEARIDRFRSSLKKAARKRIQGGSDVKMEILYIDILEELEKIGDYILEIAKELKNIRD